MLVVCCLMCAVRRVALFVLRVVSEVLIVLIRLLCCELFVVWCCALFGVGCLLFCRVLFAVRRLLRVVRCVVCWLVMCVVRCLLVVGVCVLRVV